MIGLRRVALVPIVSAYVRRRRSWSVRRFTEVGDAVGRQVCEPINAIEDVLAENIGTAKRIDERVLASPSRASSDIILKT